MSIYDQFEHAPDADPGRLEAGARLAGARPAPAHECSCLRFGCEDVEAMVGLAIRYPASTFVVVDAPAAQYGREAAGVFELTNLTFVAQDELDRAATFDYIVAPSLLSGTTPRDQHQKLTAIKRLLSPRGMALLPHATRCGLAWEAPLRDLLRQQLPPGADDDERAAAFARWLADSAPLQDPFHKQRLYDFAEQVAVHGLPRQPQRGFDVGELRGLLDRAGLRYLSDARWYRNAAHAAPAELMSHLRGAQGRADVDDVVDVVGNRRWRQALVCQVEAPTTVDPPTVALRSLRLRIRPEWAPDAPEANADAVVSRTWTCLATAHATGRASVAPAELTEATLAAADGLRRRDVVDAVHALLSAGAFEVVSAEDRLPAPRPGARPRLWPLAEMQALAGSDALLSRLHRRVVLTPTQSALATRIAQRPESRDELTAAIAQDAVAGRFPLPDGLAEDTAPDVLAEALEVTMPTVMEKILARLTRLGLMM